MVDWNTILQATTYRVQFPLSSLHFFPNWPNPFNCTMTLRSTQPLTEMGTRDLHGGKCGRLVRLTTWPPPVSRLCRKCVILYISQLYWPPQSVAGIVLLNCLCIKTEWKYFAVMSFGLRYKSLYHLFCIMIKTYLQRLVYEKGHAVA
jgi:hypothetical protein